MIAQATVAELLLLHEARAARLRCPAGAVPAPGQYVLADAAGSDAPLAAVLFPAGEWAEGFVAASPIPAAWQPGTQLWVRGPLGHGFSLPGEARRVALVAWRRPPAALLSLLGAALRQQASVTLVGQPIPEDLPLQVEAQPPEALQEVCAWADFAAFDVEREALPELRDLLRGGRTAMKGEAQALVRAPMPCGGMAACGACTVDVGGKALLACEDGPVFDLGQLMGWSSRA